MSLELRGLVSAIAAGILVLAVTFGLAAVFGRSSAQRQAPSAPGASSSAGADRAQVVAGQALYTQYCAGCHGADASGGFGPPLQHEDWNDQQITAIIRNGKKPMPAFGSKMTDMQVKSVVAYVDSMK
jgi:mono/diheme cytochrome c family protein